MAIVSRRTPSLLLELDLTAPLLQSEPDDPVGKLRSRGKPRLSKILEALNEAGSDPRVKGLVAKIGGRHLELAIAQEIRQAVTRFAASGKPTVAWAEAYGDDGNGSALYFLATAFSEIWMLPSGDLGLLGVLTEVTFLRGVLDKVGVEPLMGQRYEYKNAGNRLTRTEFTDAHREAVGRLAESAWEEIVAGISERRGLTAEQVRGFADEAPLSATKALEAGLIDRIGYRDQVYDDVRRRVGPDVRLLFANRWKNKTPVPKKVAAVITDRNQPVVALVEARGTIVSGHSRRSPMDGPQVGSDSLSAALRAARANDKARAVVLRVDSPGGSYIASDIMRREVALLRDAGKPVIVSMGAVAGSGGYFISCPAEVIVAQPTTITGSIGVVGGKLDASGLLEKIGLSTGVVTYGNRARMYSQRTGFTEDERAFMEEQLDRIYEEFLAHVSAGRGMTRDEVHEVARGRVWTGADAVSRGLVDSLGGMREALTIARERASLDEKSPLLPAIQVPMLKKIKSPQSSEDPRAVSVSMNGWGELSSIAGSLGLPSAGPLLMPNIRLR